MWKPNAIGQIIAQRELEFKNSEGLKKVTLRAGQPVRSPDAQRGEPWWCPIEIEGLGPNKFQTIAGEDALQALILALQNAKNILPIFAEKEGGSIYWLAADLDSIFNQQNMVHAYAAMAGEALIVLRDIDKRLQDSSEEDIRDAHKQIAKFFQKYPDKHDS